MVSKDEAFQQRLLATFRIEAAERIDVLSSGLIALEQADTTVKGDETLESLVREAHSLKGASRAVNLSAVEALARTIEQVLSSLKQRTTEATPALFDALHHAVDGIKRFLALPTPNDQEVAVLRELAKALEHPSTTTPTPAEVPAPALSSEVISPDVPPPETVTPAPPAEVVAAAPPAKEPAPAPPQTVTEQPIATDTVRIPTARLAALMLAVEQLTAAKLTAQQHVADLNVLQQSVGEWKKALGKTPSSPASPSEALETEKQRIRKLEAGIESLEKSLEQNYRYLVGAVANLQEDIKSILMLPTSTSLSALQKMVRDLSRDQGKEVECSVRGGEIEIDKRILDEMNDPLIHLMRNCVDHGIEKPEEREAEGKARRGRIALEVTQKSADKIEITVEDDGAGMDPARIRASALKQGIITPSNAETIDDETILTLAFRSGVTTSPIVTDISGRGLGLAIVEEKVTKLNGSLRFESRPGAGTTFHITLPLTLATFRGVIIKCCEQLFILPTANVRQVLRVSREDISTVENRATIRFRDQVVSLVKLSDVLELVEKNAGDRPDKTQIIVASAGEKTIALAVDEIHFEQEVLVKGLGKQLSRVRNIRGAATLGSGSVVPILNVQDLLISAVRSSSGPSLPEREVAEVKTHSLLVVEDSITTRTLLKNILETAGYDVLTAVDGVDALSHLREGEFDLVVSDVAMPRMNGFDLTARIRADKRMAEMPVVLVTSLESQQDKERGIDVGANAYIIKSSFDQSNLLEIIQRLL